MTARRSSGVTTFSCLSWGFVNILFSPLSSQRTRDVHRQVIVPGNMQEAIDIGGMAIPAVIPAE